MSTAEIRAEIHQIIDRLDEPFLKVVHSMLDTYVQQQQEGTVVGYDVDGNPLYASVLQKECAKRIADMKSGQSTTIEDLKKEAAEW